MYIDGEGMYIAMSDITVVSIAGLSFYITEDVSCDCEKPVTFKCGMVLLTQYAGVHVFFENICMSNCVVITDWYKLTWLFYIFLV